MSTRMNLFLRETTDILLEQSYLKWSIEGLEEDRLLISTIISEEEGFF